MSSDSAAAAATPPPAKKSLFKPSALSAVTSRMWEERKNEFKAPSVTLELEKKTLTAAPKSDATPSQNGTAATEAAPKKHIFGSAIEDRVIIPQSNADDVATTSTTGEDDKSESADGDRAVGPQSTAAQITGEENEVNILQTSVRVWMFDATRREWVERGVCVLRVNRVDTNDRSSTGYRIVVRTSGTQRVVVNSTIRADMFLEKVQSRVKFAATTPDSPQMPHVFLVGPVTKNDPLDLYSELLDFRHQVAELDGGGGESTQPAPEIMDETSLNGAPRKRKASEVAANNDDDNDNGDDDDDDQKYHASRKRSERGDGDVPKEEDEDAESGDGGDDNDADISPQPDETTISNGDTSKTTESQGGDDGGEEVEKNAGDEASTQRTADAAAAADKEETTAS